MIRNTAELTESIFQCPLWASFDIQCFGVKTPFEALKNVASHQAPTRFVVIRENGCENGYK